MAAVTVGTQTNLESDGKSVQVTLNTNGIEKGEVIVADGWLGITNMAGGSDDDVTISIDGREYQFTVPHALNVAKGDIVYVNITDLAGNRLNDSAYSKTAGAGKVAFFKATEDQDDNDVVLGIMMAQGQLAS